MKCCLVLPVLTACSFSPPAGAIDAAIEIDAPIDAALDAGPLGAFDNVTALTVLNSAMLDDDPSLTGDLLEIFFASNRDGTGFYDEDIFVATRDTVAQDFRPPARVDELSIAGTLDSNVEISADGLTITFTSGRGGGNDDLWIAKRDTRASGWNTPTNMAELNSLQGDYGGAVITLADGQHEITMCSARSGNEALYVARKAATDPNYGAPTIAAGVDTIDHECDAARPDEDTLYFTRASAATPIQLDLYRAVWDGARYIEVEPVTELNTASRDSDPWVSRDHRTIFFSRDTGNNGTDDLFMATR